MGATGVPASAGNVTAAGVWTTVNSSGGRITNAGNGEFTAVATLTANFFGAQDVEVVNGEIASFQDGNGRSKGGRRVTLDSAQLRAGSASFSGATEGTIGAGTNLTGGSGRGCSTERTARCPTRGRAM